MTRLPQGIPLLQAPRLEGGARNVRKLTSSAPLSHEGTYFLLPLGLAPHGPHSSG